MDKDEIAIAHDDSTVMLIARTIVDADEGQVNGWDWQVQGATQDSSYYSEPYRRRIAHAIEMAVAVRDALNLTAANQRIAELETQVLTVPDGWIIKTIDAHGFGAEFGSKYSCSLFCTTDPDRSPVVGWGPKPCDALAAAIAKLEAHP